MRQEVNLYLAEFPAIEKKKVSKKVAFAISLLVVLIVGGASFSYWKLQVLKDQLSIEMNASSFAKNSMDRLENVINKSASEDHLKVKLIDLKEKVSQKTAIKSNIDFQLNHGGEGFAKKFFALARQDIEGLWITSIQFTNSSARVLIKGEAQKPALIVVYLKKLSAEPAFKGVKFIDFEVDPLKNSDIVTFTISTHDIEDDDSPLEKFIKLNTESIGK